MSLLLATLLLGLELPAGAAPPALPLEHFPTRLHAVVWRNWQITPVERIAKTLGAQPERVISVGHSMGLAGPPQISDKQWRRSYITVIRANWSLLPYEQLLTLLDWSPEELSYALQEDDFLFVKLGRLKPACEPIHYAPPDKQANTRATQIANTLREAFPKDVGTTEEPLFHFVEELSAPPENLTPTSQLKTGPPRFCYSYFALYGDPLLDEALDPYPEGLLMRLRAAGVNGIWLQGVLFKLSEFPWDPSLSAGYETRLRNLNALIARAKRHGIGVYLYLNEPRSMPLAWFAGREELKGVVQGEYAALCTSHPDVQQYLRNGAAAIVRAAPELAGIFTITASENLTNCWSHHHGEACPRCGQRPAAEVIAEVNSMLADGIAEAGAKTRLIAWDWGWQDEWAPAAIGKLPNRASLMSVSEWSLPINRGGVPTTVGEYSISAVGPGPRATAHWQAAQNAGLNTFAKIQAGTTWELGSVPYLPAVNKVAEHAERLRDVGVDGVMLGWTLGGYPSPNLEVAGRVLDGEAPADAMRAVATRLYGKADAADVLEAWRLYSEAMDDYPYHGSVVYMAPHHVGPANLLWAKPTGYRATMVGIPYDDLESWRGVYPPEVLAEQFDRVGKGFLRGWGLLRRDRVRQDDQSTPLERELSVAQAAEIQFRSAANQTRFVMLRDKLAATHSVDEANALLERLEKIIGDEAELACRLYALQIRDSRIGFEATNHYFFTPLDLAEKVLNCRFLLEHWLPAERARIRAVAKLSGCVERPDAQVVRFDRLRVY